MQGLINSYIAIKKGKFLQPLLAFAGLISMVVNIGISSISWVVIDLPIMAICTVLYKYGKCVRDFLGALLVLFWFSFLYFWCKLWAQINKAIIPLAFFGYEMIKANSSLAISTVLYPKRSWNSF